MKTEIKKVKLSDIKPNPDNPRSIKNDQMERLVKSLQEFPDMMEIREIVVDENMMILGGNMRYQAMKKLKEKQAVVKIVTGLSPEQKREFIVKDNASFGNWDFDILANNWDDLPLFDWGIDLPPDWVKDNNENNDNRDDFVPDKDPNILVRLSFHPGMWLGKREEIKGILERMEKTYECKVSIEE